MAKKNEVEKSLGHLKGSFERLFEGFLALDKYWDYPVSRRENYIAFVKVLEVGMSVYVVQRDELSVFNLFVDMQPNTVTWGGAKAFIAKTWQDELRRFYEDLWLICETCDFGAVGFNGSGGSLIFRQGEIGLDWENDEVLNPSEFCNYFQYPEIYYPVSEVENRLAERDCMGGVGVALSKPSRLAYLYYSEKIKELLPCEYSFRIGSFLSSFKYKELSLKGYQALRESLRGEMCQGDIVPLGEGFFIEIPEIMEWNEETVNVVSPLLFRDFGSYADLQPADFIEIGRDDVILALNFIKNKFAKIEFNFRAFIESEYVSFKESLGLE